MTGLRLSVAISLALLAGVVAAETKDVNLVQETQQFEQGGKVAIVVGVESYNQRLNGFRPLNYAKDDAEQVAAVLKSLGYQVELLVDSQASPNVILNRIRQKGRLPGIQNGTMLFYFSGHGFAVGNDNFLAAWDAVAEDLQDSGLGISRVVDAIRSTQVRRAVLLVDACRNDPRPGSKGGSDSYADVDTGEGVQILYSTRFGDVSWEHDDFQQGVFSHFLVQGLTGQGVQNGFVTFNSLANYVESEVAKWTDRKMSQTQQPFRRTDGDVQGDFLLARFGDAAPQPVPQPPQPAPAAVETAPPARKSFEPEMVIVPGGTFTMGCDGARDDVEGGCQNDEKPAHQVTLDAFKLAQTEVTVAQFRQFVEKTGYKTTAETEGSCWSLDEKNSWSDVKGNSWRQLGYQQTDNDPVACVSWNDANAYIDWLKKETGKPYRLPTEAEWEYAARGGKGGAYPWGQQGSAGCGYANMADQTAKEKFPNWLIADCNDGYIYTAPVGKFQPNGYGLYDMHGNVWEWVQDRWHDDYKGAPVDGGFWESGDSAARVLRGGSWSLTPRRVRSAYRFNSPPGPRSRTFGFRLASGQ
ncbi:MAG: SUMF1/EgtB/PvdO family nonheme iron enzyme [Gammaproteobacteria bacterium]|nr:SUMF1/EgtB/PvdO family nonheme iron enzyme [Gammaproteobacteria bacterium]MBU1722985.1 SUMF1/EgtB/PvdO family nonheme iron enzyme [Gammaproteobacteria bacterium]MBU2007112.1 SUMF1/EgtB/PvdO family nonheme iron enzyme [Gammaproteobacteria bacterium]